MFSFVTNVRNVKIHNFVEKFIFVCWEGQELRMRVEGLVSVIIILITGWQNLRKNLRGALVDWFSGFYSERRLSTGLATAVLNECRVTVNKVIRNTIPNGSANIHHEKVIRKAKFSNHFTEDQ
jgi:hypothetical protein